MHPVWSSVEIVDDDEFADEPLGTKEKFWVHNPDDERPWLFKFAREREGRTLGEDWAEWIVHHLGTLLGVPTAQIRPATCEGRRGVVSRSVIDSVAVERLVHGNSLLVEHNPAYRADLKRENPEYAVAAVKLALKDVGAPIEFAGRMLSTGLMSGLGILSWTLGSQVATAITRTGEF